MQIVNILMAKIRRFVLKPAVLTVIGIIILGLIIWFFGPIMGYGEFYPLESQFARIVTICTLLGLAVFFLILRAILRWRKEKKLSKAVAEGAAHVDPSDEASKAEVTELENRMREALTILRKSRLGGKGGSKSLYQLPWYIMIGPPGAGKTTAIANSGLKFPLAEKMGKAAIVGVGGTRNCDWWFTNEAVLIDTAGRYTTQESDADADARSWLGFLDILKSSRTRQPINGAMVAISLSDLSLLDEAQRRTHALAIRTRLRELRETLGVRFPVYVIFTKADLIAGFSEFYERMTREEREQVWGHTFPLAKSDDDPSPLSRFDEEFDALVARLNDRTVELLQQEIDHRRRGLIYGFPQQVESLRTVAKDFLGEIFVDSAYEKRQMLRGFYFTSGTQEGTPIDRLMRTMASAFGIGRQAVGTGQGTGKSFFLTRLLQGVIFNEAGLVSADDAVERRYKWILRGSIAASVLVTAGAVTLWTISYFGNAALVAEARADIQEYRELVSTIQVSPVDDIDLDKVVAPLNTLRDMPGNPAFNEPDPPTSLTWGLYQGDVIGTEAAQTYRAGLNQLLLPRLLLRLEKQMQSNFNNADYLYPALKVYLMLGSQGPIDQELVRTWLTLDWSRTYPGGSNQELRADLAVHLDQLLSQPMTDYSEKLNGNLVAAVRDILTQLPLEERIYQSIIDSPEAKEVPDWTVRTAGGPMAARVLVRTSGAPLNEGVEGIYTYKGFTEVFLPQAVEVPDRLQKEAWVLGDRGTTLDERALANLTQNVLGLYYDDYVDRWNRVLADISVIPASSTSDAARITGLLSGASSPVRNILESAALETELTRIPEGGGPGGDFDAEGVAAGVGDELTGQFVRGLDDTTRRLLDVVSGGASVGGGSGPVEEPEPFGLYVEERFRWLHELTDAEEGAPSRLDDVLAIMQEVEQEIRLPNVDPLAPGGSVSRLKAEGEALDGAAGPLEVWVDQVVSSTSGPLTQGIRDRLNGIWTAQVMPICLQTLNGRYPFNRSAQADMALQDFQRLFAPGGLIDAFFTDHLLEYVDTTTKPWRFKTVQGQDIGIPPAVLQQFQNAADIRDAFFLSGGPPTVTFELKPVALDSKAVSVTLEVEGQALEYAHGVPQVTPMKWPGQAGGRTQIAFAPQQPNAENTLRAEGPWAWFRLLDAATMRGSNVADRSKVIFNVGGRIAVFEMRAGSALNPFSLPALSSFRCLNSL